MNGLRKSPYGLATAIEREIEYVTGVATEHSQFTPEMIAACAHSTGAAA